MAVSGRSECQIGSVTPEGISKSCCPDWLAGAKPDTNFNLKLIGFYPGDCTMQ